MKDYNMITPQEKNFCLVSCLQAILDFEGILMNQKEIAGRLTPAELGFKVNDEKINIFMKNLGFNYEFYWRNETPLNEPELVLEDMKRHHGLVGIDNHSNIFYDFNYPNVMLIDPNDAKIKIRKYENMIREMYYPEGFFGLIKKI